MNQKISEPMRQPPPAEVKALIALYNEQRFAEVDDQAQHLIRQYPDAATLWKLLGAALQMQGKDALSAFRKVAELMPGDAEAHNNLGVALLERGQPDDAMASFRSALAIDPGFIEAHYNLGNVLSELGRFEEAVVSYRDALKLNPDFALIHSNLGAAQQELGRFDEALASCRRALELDPDLAPVHSNLLGMLNSTSGHTAAYRLEEARKYGRMVSRKVASRFSSWQCEEYPQRLRVGIVSTDLHKHPVGYALKCQLPYLDPARVDLFAYPASAQVDELTESIQPHFAAWQPIYNLSDEEAARLIHADGVHVLLDLSGHTEQNRLPVFAWKPAPVQASWLGYFATTGVAEMDYLMTSEAAVPKEHQGQYTETVWYLPDTWLCFTPPAADLQVGPLPALKNGHLTFGCFQRLDKFGKEVLPAWAKILGALPDARLYLACKQLGDAGQAAQFSERLQQHGIDPSRVTLQGPAPSREGYLARYNEVDVILDSFPYPGVTTTCEALWMGVPTITLAGDTLLSRQGAGVVSAAGLQEWIATDVDEYVAKAVEVAGDLPKLAALRAGLREQVSTSPLFDAKRFAKNFEDAMWGMWQARKRNGSSATTRVA
jgi:protein O-GlcNAc transferase